MAEKRQHRKNCKVFMRVFNSETDQLVGQMANLTTQGLMLTGDAHIAPGTAFVLRLELPEEIKGVRTLTLSSMSRWCEPDEDTPQFYNTGFHLEAPSKQDVKVIKQLMKKYCF